jgi:MoxR-like ATPase
MTTQQTQQMDNALLAAEKIQGLRVKAGESFIERDDALLAMAIALVAGEHIIFFAKPGTAKTQMGDWFSKALGLRYFYTSLGTATELDELFGPINPLTIHTQWERVPAGLMTANIAFLDEVGKAPAEVQHYVLSAMQERKIAVGDKRFEIPLHTLMAASNETIDDNPAFFDRFGLRVLVNYVSQADNFLKMLTADVDSPPQTDMHISAFGNMRQVCRDMARFPHPNALKAMGELWSTYPIKFKDERPISDRRWRLMLTMGAAHALLNGNSMVNAIDLSVGRFMLWQSTSTVTEIGQWVSALTDKEINLYRENEKLLKETEARYSQLPPTATDKDKAAILYDVSKLNAKIKPFSGRQWDDLRQRCAALSTHLMTVADPF